VVDGEGLLDVLFIMVFFMIYAENVQERSRRIRAVVNYRLDFMCDSGDIDVVKRAAEHMVYSRFTLKKKSLPSD